MHVDRYDETIGRPEVYMEGLIREMVGRYDDLPHYTCLGRLFVRQVQDRQIDDLSLHTGSYIKIEGKSMSMQWPIYHAT